jgi:hypothetical protein
MKFDTTTIEQALDNMITNLELLDTHMEEIKKSKHKILAIQRQIKDINDQISIERNKHPQNKTYITTLCDKDYLLQLELKATSRLETKLSETMEAIYMFLNNHYQNTTLIQKLTDGDIKMVNDIYQLNSAQSLSKSRPILLDYVTMVSDADLIELVNTKFELTGYKRFYLENESISSIYCNDLKAILLDALSIDNFSGLVTIIRDTVGNKHILLKPIQILQSIITYHNKRKIK